MSENPSRRCGPAQALLCLALPAAILTILNWHHILPFSDWMGTDRASKALQYALLADAALPRSCMALLCGAALGASGAILQQVMRNPLAEPTTMGVSAGSYLALTLSVLLAPGLALPVRDLVVFGGGAAAILIVLGIGTASRFAPSVLAVSGITVSLYCGAVTTFLVLSDGGLRNLSVWGSGALDVLGWQDVTALAWQVPLLLAACLPLLRPLTLLDLDTEGARSLGLSLPVARILALTVALLLAVIVVVKVGIISFVGLAAPVLASLAGARLFPARLGWAVLLGAALLWLTDATLQTLAPILGSIPTGSVTAILGAPAMLWLLPRAKRHALAATAGFRKTSRQRPATPILTGLLTVGLFAAFVSLHLGIGPRGWRWSDGAEMHVLSVWRAPRMVAAGSAGAMLGLAGTLLQRLTGNPMASPELLGVSSGAALGVVILALLHPVLSLPLLLLAAMLGAGLTLAAMLGWNARRGFAPERMLLAGVTLAMALSGVQASLLASGNARLYALLSWLSGSTYLVQWPEAKLGAGITVLLGLGALFTRRWLDLLALGPASAQSAGLNLLRERGVIMLLAALLTATATIVVGPLSFVGLVAPHIARLMGLGRSRAQLLGSALTGGTLMILADFLGRVVLFPDQVPAGLVAALLGGSYLLFALAR